MVTVKLSLTEFMREYNHIIHFSLRKALKTQNLNPDSGLFGFLKIQQDGEQISKAFKIFILNHF